jgi:hypothetical protein
MCGRSQISVIFYSKFLIILKFLCSIDTLPVPDRYTSCARQIHFLCSTDALPVPNRCTSCARQMHFLCSTDALPVPDRCTSCARQIHFLLDFTTSTILGKEYRSFSSSLCNFLHSTVISVTIVQIRQFICLIYLSGSMTAVSVSHKPNIIPLCFSIHFVLYFSLSWLHVLLPSMFF